MKLKSFQIREFQSVKDSGVVEIEDIACLVGKNEAGKSALLKALYRLNPIIDTDNKFDVTHDYPRMDVEDYRLAIEGKKRKHAVPIMACYSLDEEEINDINYIFGVDCIKTPEMTLSKNYENKLGFSFDVDDNKAIDFLVGDADFSEQTRGALRAATQTVESFIEVLQSQEPTEEVKRITTILCNIKTRGVVGYIWDTILKPRWPKFLYFDEYY